ncbi:MAG TPA: TonB-dependent receptor, partial [Chitinophagaceae bacterium]|nr:TonB-dependent receptor [Chitinophagaceae bacterium]
MKIYFGRFYFLLMMLLAFYTGHTQQETRRKILSTPVEDFIFLYKPSTELEKMIQQFGLKIIYNKERLDQFSLAEEFYHTTLANVLITLCKKTRSKFFISGNGTIYITGAGETNTEIVQAVKQSANDVRITPVEKPTKFNISVSGKVMDFETGEPLPNVSVAVDGKNIAAVSNADGRFTLYDVPSDTAVLMITSIGYEPYKMFLDPKQKTDSLAIEMMSKTNSLAGVTVTAKLQQAFKLNQKISMIKMSPSQLAALPNMGEKDIFRSFQLMPGISAANENTSGLYVRGGTPDQSLVLFDGFTVYNVDHLFGFFSAFNSNAIKDVQLYKGGFEAKYGGRISSVVDITGKEGNKKTFNIGGDISLLSINLFAESPVGKNASALVTYRRSFHSSLYDKIFNKYSGAGNNDETESSTQNNTPFSQGNQSAKSYFYDLNAKLTWKPNKKDVFRWSYYGGKDNLDNSIKPQLPSFLASQGIDFGININDVTKWGNTGSSIKWSREWNKKIYTNTLLSYSNYFSNRDNSVNGSVTNSSGSKQEIKNGTLENNDLKDFTLKTNMEYKPSKNHNAEFGYNITYNHIVYTYGENDTSTVIDRNTKGIQYTGFAQDKISLLNKKLSLIPGIRITFFDQTSKLYYEPRLNATYELNDRLKLKAAAGMYYQFAKRVIREDILQGSRDFWVLADNEKLPVSSTKQYVLGASWENNIFLIDVEAYYKKMSGLTEYSLRYTPAGPGASINYSENFYPGTGTAKGIDFLVQKKSTEIQKGSCPSGTAPVNLHELFPKSLIQYLVTGIQNFNKNMTGFISDESILYGVETRTSCPVRVTRDDQTLESISYPGLYPCGEGAGYAGGITSAACDGVKIAEK